MWAYQMDRLSMPIVILEKGGCGGLRIPHLKRGSKGEYAGEAPPPKNH